MQRDVDGTDGADGQRQERTDSGQTMTRGRTTYGRTGTDDDDGTNDGMDGHDGTDTTGRTRRDGHDGTDTTGWTRRDGRTDYILHFKTLIMFEKCLQICSCK